MLYIESFSNYLQNKWTRPVEQEKAVATIAIYYIAIQGKGKYITLSTYRSYFTQIFNRVVETQLL